MSFRFASIASITLYLGFMQACSSLRGPIAPAAIPPRLSGAPNGQAFVSSIRGVNEISREQSILQQLRSGNIPDFLRQMERFSYEGKTRSGQKLSVTLWVMRDYLAIGGNGDFVRVPMNPVTAQRAADHFGLVLPTVKIVDEIYRAAAQRLPPKPFPPSNNMVTVDEFVRHDRVITQQLGGDAPNQLLAGHKKDVVLTNQLNAKPNKVAIYGWHQPSGNAIQPLSTVHGNWYADYSHGIRLISGMVLIAGKPRALVEVMQDPDLAPLVNYEGPLQHIRYRTEDVAARSGWAPRS